MRRAELRSHPAVKGLLQCSRAENALRVFVPQRLFSHCIVAVRSASGTPPSDPACALLSLLQLVLVALMGQPCGRRPALVIATIRTCSPPASAGRLAGCPTGQAPWDRRLDPAVR